MIYLRKPGLVNTYTYSMNEIQCVPRKRFGSAVWDTIYTIYLSHTQPADPNPFLGTHGMYVYMCQFCILYLVLEWVPKRGGRRTHCILSLYIYEYLLLISIYLTFSTYISSYISLSLWFIWWCPITGVNCRIHHYTFLWLPLPSGGGGGGYSPL